MTRRSRFHVPKMDCAAEEQLVRSALEDVQGIRRLGFDLGARSVDVFHDDAVNVAVDMISRRLEGLGLGARLVGSEAVANDAVAREGSDALERRTLLLLLAINAVMFVTEQIAGWLASSTGLLADSLDMLADASVYGIALWAVAGAAAAKMRAARLSGWLQAALAAGALAEVLRRFIFGSEPDPAYMMGVAGLALAANIACLLLIARHRSGGVHMKASWIFSTNDVIANVGVIIAGALVAWTGSRLPDLVIGAAIAALVLSGAIRILRLSQPTHPG